MNKDLIIEKQKELIGALDTFIYDQVEIELFPDLRKELSALESEPDKESEYEPCDVEGCDIEGCSGGVAWKKTGYWVVCSKHSASEMNGDIQPKMKQSAIEREESRDKVTGYLHK